MSLIQNALQNAFVEHVQVQPGQISLGRVAAGTLLPVKSHSPFVAFLLMMFNF